jgi:hypothetical protein
VYWFDQVVQMARPVFYDDEVTVVNGEVSSGIEVFRLSVPRPLELSMEVMATEAGGMGGTDSVLTVVDAEGRYIAQDDDGAFGGMSRLGNVFLDRAGDYYVVVSSFPNFGNFDGADYLEGFPENGESAFTFELVFGPPAEGGYDNFDDYGTREPYPDDGVPAGSFNDIVRAAQPIRMSGMEGVGSGEVGIGFASFEIEVDGPLYATIEVVVTEVRQGVSFADSDSMLFLYDETGSLVAMDDDGGESNASMLESVWLPEAGRYYAIVTTYPNEPYGEFGLFAGLDTLGESNIAFDLVVRLDIAAM